MARQLSVAIVLFAGISGALQSATAQTSPSQLLEEAGAHYRALRPAEAVRLYREYLAQYPDRADVRTYLGAALLNLNQRQAALEEVKRAITLDDRYAKAYTLAGRIYAEQEQWELSKKCFEEAVLLDPNDRDAWYFFGRSSYDANRFEQAIECFLRGLKLGAEQSRVYESLGLAYEALNQSEPAEKAYRHALELTGSTYRPYVSYGLFLFKQGRIAESQRLLEQAFRMEPNVDVRFALGRVLYHAGKLAEASRTLEGALPSDDCRLHNLLAKVYANQGRHSEAGKEVEFLASCRGDKGPR